MEPIFDADGSVVAWLNREVVHGLDGKALVFVENAGVYSYDGKQRGTFSSGYFREASGNAVAFVGNAQGSPALPFPKLTPLPPLPALLPLQPIHDVPAIPPIPTLAWSTMSWEDFIG
jgi:hypothetical protein